MRRLVGGALVASAFVLAAGAVAPLNAAVSPQAAVDELLAADRAFSSASAKSDVVSGLGAMFADEVVVPLPTGGFAEGRTAAIAALRANAENLTSRAEWTPVRAGISADGLHCFTAGFMTLHRPDGTTMALKYLAYWVKQAGAWRAAAYKRTRGAATPPLELMASTLPAQMVEPSSDTGAIARHNESLAAAERAFSSDAQKIGLGPAFAQYGSADAINLGGPSDSGLIVGNEAIAKSVGDGGPATGSAVSWGPDRVIVASSGDLGVSIGVIKRNAPVANQPGAFPFFTIWRRPSPAAPWRYIAE
jgi:ketosteroid isomerase-like protein